MSGTQPAASGPLLSVRDLSVVFGRRGQPGFTAVDRVSFDVAPGEVVGIVGESGSGKSVTSMAVMGLLPPRGVAVTGQALYRGRDLLTLPDRERARYRGAELAMVFQDPMTSLNPVVTVGVQVTEVLHAHERITRAAAKEQAIDLLRRCGIPDPARRFGEYPHQLSGGMRQRALIATALACKPKLLICDEPTTALDVTIQAQVLELLVELVNDLGTAMIMITHDLGVVAGLCDRVNVMYAGRIVERAGACELFAHPRHRYTQGLLNSIPRLDGDRSQPLTPIPGTPRDVIGWAKACAFAPRCRYVTDACVRGDLELVAMAPSHDVRCVHPAESPQVEPTQEDPSRVGPVETTPQPEEAP
ncbi:ABC transporter ATP-binding protein [Propioniciclava sp.]|uniref:ABC transporter ATP-binding protein n=1 Tax=Propioniciclava sp. TaxID=2038686 RepID=UPI0026126863|nr:ABC transporter ATP-binding protein [Propioniciclava sp.]